MPTPLYGAHLGALLGVAQGCVAMDAHNGGVF